MIIVVDPSSQTTLLDYHGAGGVNRLEKGLNDPMWSDNGLDRRVTAKTKRNLSSNNNNNRKQQTCYNSPYPLEAIATLSSPAEVIFCPIKTHTVIILPLWGTQLYSMPRAT